MQLSNSAKMCSFSGIKQLLKTDFRLMRSTSYKSNSAIQAIPQFSNSNDASYLNGCGAKGSLQKE